MPSARPKTAPERKPAEKKTGSRAEVKKPFYEPELNRKKTKMKPSEKGRSKARPAAKKTSAAKKRGAKK